MKKLKHLGGIFIVALLMGACSNNDAPQQDQTPVAKELQKTVQMTNFEKGFAGISQRMSVSSAAKEEETVKITAVCRAYLSDNGQTIAKDATRADIVKQALSFHQTEIQHLRNQQIQ